MAGAGMIGPALFVTVFTIEGWLRPGYDAWRMFISELSLGPRGFVQIANFVMLGVFFLGFARGVATEFREGRASKAGPLLLTFIGCSFLSSGPMVMDPASTPRELWSLHGTLHQILGALVFSLAPVSCFLFWRRFRADPAWRTLQRWSFAAGIIITAAVLVLKVGISGPPAERSALRPWIGLIQRTALVTYLAFIFRFALALYQRADTE
jgi:cytochrome bd-type quinol oxidase subunit 2